MDRLSMVVLSLLLLCSVFTTKVLASTTKAIRSIPIKQNILTTMNKIKRGKKILGVEWLYPVSFDTYKQDFYFLKPDGIVLVIDRKGKFKKLFITKVKNPIDIALLKGKMLILNSSSISVFSLKGKRVGEVKLPPEFEPDTSFFFNVSGKLLVGDPYSKVWEVKFTEQSIKLVATPYKLPNFKTKYDYTVITPVLSKNLKKNYYFVVASDTEIPQVSKVVNIVRGKVKTQTNVPPYPGFDVTRWIVVDKAGVVWCLYSHLGELKLEGF